jgi:hypothetical protein
MGNWYKVFVKVQDNQLEGFSVLYETAVTLFSKNKSEAKSLAVKSFSEYDNFVVKNVMGVEVVG